MLKNLLKYEFRATARTYGGIYLALLAAAGLIGFSLRGDRAAAQSHVFELGVTIYSLLVMALVIVTIVTVIQRFTKNLLGREGYLMHTLPVTEAQLVGSKLISSAVWLLASAVVGVVSLVVMFCVGADFTNLNFSNLWDDWAALRTSFEGDLLAILLGPPVLCPDALHDAVYLCRLHGGPSVPGPQRRGQRGRVLFDELGTGPGGKPAECRRLCPHPHGLCRWYHCERGGEPQHVDLLCGFVCHHGGVWRGVFHPHLLADEK